MYVPTDLNVLDWGRGDQLAVALGGSVYLLDTKKGGINNLCELQPNSLYVSSLQWNRTGKYLAVGTSDAEVQVCVCTCMYSTTLQHRTHG
jgi:cell division cycle protein 20 (cofactor of APC complex)